MRDGRESRWEEARAGPPLNMIGYPVDLLAVLLSRPGDLAVAVTNVCAYPMGFEFDLIVKSARFRTEHEWFAALRDESRWGNSSYTDVSASPVAGPVEVQEVEEEEDAFLELAVEFPDGPTFLNGPLAGLASAERPGAFMMTRIGSSGADGWGQDARYWIESLPGEGQMKLVCTWEGEGLRGAAKVDTRALREAALRAIPL